LPWTGPSRSVRVFRYQYSCYQLEYSRNLLFVRGTVLALAAPVSGGVLGGRQAEIAHQLARGLEPGDVPEFGQHDDGAGKLHAPERLERLDQGGQRRPVPRQNPVRPSG
jgi:hypothetical protein